MVLVAMAVVLGLARLAANVYIVLVAIAAVGGAAAAILNGRWVGWSDLVSHSLAFGAVAALLSLPALPFSSFIGKRK